MPTLRQLGLKKEVDKKKFKRSRVKDLSGGPQRKVAVLKCITMPPRKPNSAKRAVAIVRVFVTKKRLYCHIPGIGTNLNDSAIVLMEGKGCKDVANVNYSLIRGALSYKALEVHGRENKRSKFGAPKVQGRVRLDVLENDNKSKMGSAIFDVEFWMGLKRDGFLGYVF